MAIFIRPYEAADAASLVDVYRAAVRSIAARDYTEAQVRAWVPDVIDQEKFGRLCEMKLTWVATVENRVAGFSDLEADGHIHMLFVHPDFQRRGVAHSLLQKVQSAAMERKLHRLYAEVSITGRPAFEAQGFRVIVCQQVAIRGESLTNYRMEKRFDSKYHRHILRASEN